MLCHNYCNLKLIRRCLSAYMCYPLPSHSPFCLSTYDSLPPSPPPHPALDKERHRSAVEY